MMAADASSDKQPRKRSADGAQEQRAGSAKAARKGLGGAGRRGQGVGAPLLLAPPSLHGHNMAGC